MKNQASAVFTTLFAMAEPIQYNPEWAEFGGYFGGALYDECSPQLAPGKIVGCAADDGRLILILGTQLGNALVFQRYTDNVELYAKCFTVELEKHFSKDLEPRITATMLEYIFGGDDQSDLSAKLTELPAEELDAMRAGHARYIARRKKLMVDVM